MSDPIRVEAELTLTPQQVAEAFWNLSAKQQAEFFAAMDRIAAPGTLCAQMAFAVIEIAERSAKGDFGPMNGFRTMFAHANEYAESATDLRCWEAKREIARMAVTP